MRYAPVALALVVVLADPASAATAAKPRQSAEARAVYGGAQVAIYGSGAARYNVCGLGMAWRLANKTAKVLTAGHCVATSGGSSSKVVRYRSPSGALMGTPYSVKYGSGRDVAILNYRYSPTQYAYHGGTSTTTLIRLDGFTGPTKGATACVSGGVRGTSCGWTMNRFVDVYDTRGVHLGIQYEATHPLVSGRCPADYGDSGSTVIQRTSQGTWLLGMMSSGKTYASYCTMSFVTVATLINQIGGEPMTRATP